jgi:hypothetical protein
VPTAALADSAQGSGPLARWQSAWSRQGDEGNGISSAPRRPGGDLTDSEDPGGPARGFKFGRGLGGTPDCASVAFPVFVCCPGRPLCNSALRHKLFVWGRAFVVHNRQGARVDCAVLH